MKTTVKKRLALAWITSSLLATSLAVISPAFAKVSEEQAAKLGTELTAFGANPAANAAGTIPARSYTLDGVPKGLSYKSGDVYPDPYANEKPLFTITADNMAQYQEQLSEGQKALFKQYPKTFKMPVYPSHRESVYNPMFEKRTRWNATNTKLVRGIDGMYDYTGGIPFPIPQDGAETLWNSRVAHPHPVSDATYDDIAVFANGTQSKRRSHLITESPYAYSDMPIGKGNQDMGPYAALVFGETLEPARQKGEMVIVHEPLDWVNNKRAAWVYLPGSRRVRRAPNVGYDTPNGPGGFATVDDALGFNGAMDRYNWTLVGKKDIYIPYHNYRYDDPAQFSLEKLLTPLHVNPDAMRYELHRVWIVEADLRSDKRHIYAKRRFYIDEDSWLIALVDSYDGKGLLWRVGIYNSLYDYDAKAYITRSNVNHDLVAKGYVAQRLVNDTEPANFAVEPKGAGFYTPKNLRKMGR
jgi:hypothetical protein